MTFERYDVVIVPFPFTDKAASKRRPAVVLSSAANFHDTSEHLVMAMITTATENAWPLDVAIVDRARTGLSVDCSVRCKLFTLDARLIVRKAGTLGAKDRKAVAAAMRVLLVE